MSNEIKEKVYRIFDKKLKEEICEIKKIGVNIEKLHFLLYNYINYDL